LYINLHGLGTGQEKFETVNEALRAGDDYSVV